MKKILILIIYIFASSCAQALYSPKVTREYDKVNDFTVFSTNSIPIKEKEIGQVDLDNDVSLSAFYVCKSNQSCDPTFFMLSIISTSNSWKYLDSEPIVSFYLDGERFKIKASKNNSVLTSGNVMESFSLKLDIEQFRKLAFGKDVIIKVAYTDVPIKTELRQVLRNLYKGEITPGA